MEIDWVGRRVLATLSLLISFQIGQPQNMINMTSTSDLSSALATLSVGCGDTALFSLASLPKEIIIGIAECLCHESLVQLGATCSPLRQIVSNDLNSHWKALHDKRWRSGKRFRFTGPPSQRPRGGVTIVHEDIDWKAEFIRRVALDKMLKLRANNMRQEWIEDPNEKELVMSIDEVLASPDAGKIIVQTNIDYAADCKQDELGKTIKMIALLCKKGKVSPSDIMAAMADVVEFIDSFACDNPRIYDYVGDMFTEFANVNALSVDWLCVTTSKVMDNSCKPKR